MYVSQIINYLSNSQIVTRYQNGSGNIVKWIFNYFEKSSANAKIRSLMTGILRLILWHCNEYTLMKDTIANLKNFFAFGRYS